MAALLVLLLFISGIAFFEVRFIQEKQEPSYWERNGKLLMYDAEGFQNGTVILNLENIGGVPVNLNEVYIKESKARYSEKLEVITSIRQEISAKFRVITPIIVTFSTENLDVNRTYVVGCSWTTKTGQGSSSSELVWKTMNNTKTILTNLDEK